VRFPLPRRARSLALGSLLAAALLVACSSQSSTCDELPLSPETSEQLTTASTAVDFAPQLPCAYRDDLEVAGVFDNRVGSAPRINFLVERRDERVYIFSQTQGEVPFLAIPRSTRNIAITTITPAGETITASGFAGPTEGGDDVAYLRWRIDGVTHELATILTPWFDEQDTLNTAAALITSR
jgi:hypothetical protein